MNTTRRGLFKFFGAATAAAVVVPALPVKPVKEKPSAKPQGFRQKTDGIVLHERQVVDISNDSPIIEVTSHSDSTRMFVPAICDAGRINLTLEDLTHEQRRTLMDVLRSGAEAKFTIGDYATFSGKIISLQQILSLRCVTIKVLISIDGKPLFA